MAKKKKVKEEKPIKGFEVKPPKPEKKRAKKQKLKKYDPCELADKKSGDVVLLNGLDIDNVYIAFPKEGQGMSAVNLKQMDYALKLSDLLDSI